MDALINLVIFLILISLGYISGRMIESRHYRSIEAREEEFLRLPAVTLRHALEGRVVAKVALVAGNTVISVDYFKRFLASLRNVFGGRVTSYESLIDRARREAILRMKEEAKGADIILNMRLETSSISKGRKGNVSSVEALAYGTAVTYKPGAAQAPPSSRKRIGAQQSSAVSSPKATLSADTQYKVVFSGEIAEGQDVESVKADVAALYKVSVEKCEELFSGRRVTVKDNLDAQTAQKYKDVFEKTGAICRIEPM